MHQPHSAKKKTSHKAKTTSEWKKCLRQLAVGEKFGRGEKPPNGSHWHDANKRIMDCPAHQARDN